MKNIAKHNPITRPLAAFAGVIVTGLLTGCHHGPIAHGEAFYDGDASTNTGKMAMAQTSAGAKEDGMLYDRNFTGQELNSLGQGKLDLIKKGTAAGDTVHVYLNMPHDRVADRQMAVTTYLKTAGVDEKKIIVAEGPNPNLSTPTAYNMGGIYKQEGTSFSGQAAADAGGAAPGMAPAGK